MDGSQSIRIKIGIRVQVGLVRPRAAFAICDELGFCEAFWKNRDPYHRLAVFS